MSHNKTIIDLCGGTGAWSKPYKDAGYNVLLITLPEMDVQLYNADTEPIHGILAAPPCTEFSTAKDSTKRNLKQAMSIVSACLRIIWECRMHNGLAFWALENPVGLLRQFLGRPQYTFQPWWFGDHYTKRTDLWGYFNTPKRTVLERPASLPYVKHGQRGVFCGGNAKKFLPDYLKNIPLTRAEARAVTPTGFAQAFFEANK